MARLEERMNQFEVVINKRIIEQETKTDSRFKSLEEKTDRITGIVNSQTCKIDKQNKTLEEIQSSVYLLPQTVGTKSSLQIDSLMEGISSKIQLNVPTPNKEFSDTQILKGNAQARPDRAGDRPAIKAP